MISQPELAVVTHRGPDDGLMLSPVSQLLEHGVHFEHGSGDGKPNGIVWARGMLHALLGMLYLLEEMDPADPAFRDVLAPLEEAGHALMCHQDRAAVELKNLDGEVREEPCTEGD